jgi:3-hydroxyacyl-CoA dehydrogenase
MKLDKIDKITVVGAGVMGHSLAQVFAQNGYSVKLIDLDHDILEHALELIKSTLETLVELGELSHSEIQVILDRIEPTTDLSSALKDADFVLEAVAEVPEIKKALFSQLNKFCLRGAVLASNTSGLDIFNIVDVDNPERLIITHWFAPPHIIPLVEVVPGEETSAEVISLTVEILESLGKKPVVMNKFVPAFIVNRIQNTINSAVFEMIDNGWASPDAIDRAIKYSLGIRLPIVGVAQSLDFAGLDLIDNILQRVGTQSTYLEEKVKGGNLGAKTSKGIYDYKGRTEAEILKKRDALYLKLLNYLKKINAFEPV